MRAPQRSRSIERWPAMAVNATRAAKLSGAVKAEGREQEFQTFPGKQWAAKYAKKIVTQGRDVIPIVRV
jgi:hypothetical protein